jgi:hypothetical protein
MINTQVKAAAKRTTIANELPKAVQANVNKNFNDFVYYFAMVDAATIDLLELEDAPAIDSRLEFQKYSFDFITNLQKQFDFFNSTAFELHGYTKHFYHLRKEMLTMLKDGRAYRL